MERQSTPPAVRQSANDVQERQINELFNEINDQVEIEQWQKFWHRYRVMLIAGALLFFAGLFSYVGWQDYRRAKDHATAEIYLSAYEAFERGAWSQVLERTVPLRDGDTGYRLLAGLLDAKALAESGKRDDAISRLEEVARAAGERSPLAMVAWLNAAYLTADHDRGRTRALLGHISPPPSASAVGDGGHVSPFYARALELDGVMLEQDGDATAALQRYQQALTHEVSGSGQARLQRRVARLQGPEVVPAAPDRTVQ
jgi:predicted negative regulator of RcsB-dependent stress response